MIPCGPIQHNLPKSALQFALNFTAVVVLATPAFAQAVPKYDAATETILKVAVQELKFVPPTGAKPAAYLVTKSGPDAVQIFLCPKSFLDTIGAEFKAGDEIQVTGSKVKQDGADLILAREVVKGGDTLTLRFKDGKPAW
jgi:hypothetical protein